MTLVSKDRRSDAELVLAFVKQHDQAAKRSILDMLATDERGRLLNIEMQTSLPSELCQRLAYYASCQAFQASLQRRVALKMIPNAAFAASQDLARLRAEALAAARLSHPNIVQVSTMCCRSTKGAILIFCDHQHLVPSNSFSPSSGDRSQAASRLRLSTTCWYSDSSEVACELLRVSHHSPKETAVALLN